MLINLLRKLRHKKFKSFSPLWIQLGNIYRFFAPLYKFKCNQYIGNYGPFKFDPEFLFSNYESFGNNHNRGFNHLIRNLKSVDIFFDIGAHIGLVSLPAGKEMKRTAKVVSFEPSCKNFKHLKSHVENNSLEKIIILNHCLVGEENCQRIFYSSKKESPMNSIVKSDHLNKYKKEKLMQITLDSFCHKSGLIPEVIKIDVEGAEINVLKGARNILKKYKPIIYLSVHPRHIKELGSDIIELINLIDEIGYKVEDFEGNQISNYSLDEYLLTPKNI